MMDCSFYNHICSLEHISNNFVEEQDTFWNQKAAFYSRSCQSAKPFEHLGVIEINWCIDVFCFLFFLLQRHRNYVKQQKRAANKRALRKWRSFEMNADEYYREVCITSPASYNHQINFRF